MVSETTNYGSTITTSLNNLFKQSPAFVCLLTGEDYVFEMANEQFQQLVGHRDILGKTLDEALPELKEQGFIDLLDSVRKTKKPFIGNEMKVSLKRAAAPQEDRFLNFIYQAVHEESSDVTGIFVHGVDVTDSVLARRKITENEERYRTLLNTVDEGFCIVEVIFDKKRNPVDYRFIEVNGSFEKLTGIEDPVGKTIKELVPGIEPIGYKTFGKIALTGKPARFETNSQILDKEFSVYGVKVGDLDSNTVAVIFTSTRERREAYEVQRRLAAIVEYSDDAIIGKNLNSIITSWNKGAEKIFGYTAEEMIGKSIRDIIPPELQSEEDNILTQLRKGKPIEHFQTVRLKKDGSRVELSISVSPIKNSEGKIVGASKIARDLTRQQYLERQKDIFMGIVSHELKTPVTSIKAFTQVLQNRFEKAGDASSSNLLGKMDGQIDRLSNLISDLLDVTRIEGGKMRFNETIFLFDDMVDEVIEEVQRTTTSHTIRKHGVSKKAVFGDRDRIGQVLINMLTNAIKYSPDSYEVIVRVTANQKHIILKVQDFGVGISKEEQKHIFERFYRTTDAVTKSISGIGLGMYISSEIIKREQGKIWVKSTPGEGSTFSFSLPIVTAGHDAPL